MNYLNIVHHVMVLREQCAFKTSMYNSQVMEYGVHVYWTYKGVSEYLVKVLLHVFAWLCFKWKSTVILIYRFSCWKSLYYAGQGLSACLVCIHNLCDCMNGYFN